jgi:hypothetical protein
LRLLCAVQSGGTIKLSIIKNNLDFHAYIDYLQKWRKKWLKK